MSERFQIGRRSTKRWRIFLWQRYSKDPRAVVSAIHDCLGFTLQASWAKLHPGDRAKTGVVRERNPNDKEQMNYRVLRVVDREEVMTALRATGTRRTRIAPAHWYEIIAD